MKIRIPVLCLALFFTLIAVYSEWLLAQDMANSPRLFAPGVVSGAADDMSPAFTPDGKTVFFTRGNDSGSMILVPHFLNGEWSAPAIASFSGKWNDLEPAMAPDGSFLAFASSRPAASGVKSIEGNLRFTYLGKNGVRFRFTSYLAVRYGLEHSGATWG